MSRSKGDSWKRGAGEARNLLAHRLWEQAGGFLSAKESQPVVGFVEGRNPWERIADSIDRLAEALTPRQEVALAQVQVTLTPQQVAKRVGVNVQTVMKWCRQGKMGRKEPGGHRWVISMGEVVQYEKSLALISGVVKGGRR